MKRYLIFAATCLTLAAIGAAVAILDDPGGAKSAGVAPNAPEAPARPGQKRSTPREHVSLDTEITVKDPGGTPNHDYILDLDGDRTPLPDAVLKSLGSARERRLHPRTAPRYAASPDGSRLAYVGTGEEGTPQIFIGGLEWDTEVRQVTHDPKGTGPPAWSPDGRTIAYQGSAGKEVFLLDVAGGEPRELTTARPVDPWSGLQFTPDGSSVLYSAPSGPYDAVLWAAPVDGGKSTVLIGPEQGMGHAANGALSPDGSLVTVIGNELGGPGAVRFVANADGTEKRFIPGRSLNPSGAWSPDGRRLVASGSDSRSNRSVIIVDVETGRISPVARGNSAIWLNDDALLIEVS